MSLLLLLRSSKAALATSPPMRYPGPVPKRPDYRGRLKARRKAKKQEEEILFWVMVQELIDGDD